MKKTTSIALVAGLMVASGASAIAFPGYTAGKTDVIGSQGTYFDGIYGGPAFTGMNSTSWTNGTITATRVDDITSGGGAGTALNLDGTNGGAGVTDQIWKDGFVQAMAEARFAGFSQGFGAREDDNSAAAGLFDVVGSGFAVTGNGVAGPTSDPSGLFEWTRSNAGGGGTTYSSDNTDNTGGNDHMVTYRITTTDTTSDLYNEGRAVWMVFFEDLPEGNAGADWDYNDLVVQISVVPVPPAALLGLAGLMGVGVLRRRMSA